MRRLACLIALGFACSSSPPPPGAHDLQLSDGFRAETGVALTSKHLIAPLDLVLGSDNINLLDAAGRRGEAKVLVRARELGLALLLSRSLELDPAELSGAGSVAPGAPLSAATFASGAPVVRSGTFTGWRNHEGRVYLQSDLPLAKEDKGAGVYDAAGKLVGVVAMVKDSALTYVLPIEYATVGERALTAHPETSRLISELEETPALAALRAEAARHPEPLMPAVTLESVAFTQYFSRTALVGEMSLLAKPDQPLRPGSLRYRLEAVDAQRTRRTLSEGVIEASNTRWHAEPEKKKELAQKLAAAYGHGWVAEHFEPYDYGALRYRVPFGSFCAQVTAEEVHVLTVLLSDGRTSGDIGFSDLVNVCAGTEEGEGTALERAWGMSSEAPPPSAKKAKKAKGKRKKR